MPVGDRVVYDTGTGEVIWTLQPGDRIIPKKTLEQFADDDTRMAFTNGAWGKTYSVALNKLARLPLTASEYKMILVFLPLVRPASGLIAYGNYKPVNMEWVEKELEISHKTACRTIQKLLDYRIISKSISGGETIYFFNPYIHQKGRYINKTLFEMFKKSEWAKEVHK